MKAPVPFYSHEIRIDSMIDISFVMGWKCKVSVHVFYEDVCVCVVLLVAFSEKFETTTNGVQNHF